MINTAITVDVASPNLPVVAFAEQGDKLSRQLTVTMMENGTAWTPPTGATATVRYVKPDGTGGFYDHVEDNSAAITVSGNVATVKLAQQMLTVAGDVYCQLSWYTSTVRTSTFCWRLIVEAAPIGDSTIVSTDYWNILTTQIQTAVDAAERAEEAAESMEGMTATATASEPGSAANVVVSGGPEEGEPYHLAFTIPRGTTGPTGPAPTVASTTINYAISASGTTIPTTGWSASIPTPEKGKYIWTRTVTSFGDSGSSTTYSVAYYGADGTGAVDSVNGETGAVTLYGTMISRAADVAQTISAALTALETSITGLLSKITSGSGDRVYTHNGSTQSDLGIDTTATSGSTNLITSGAVYSKVNGLITQWTSGNITITGDYDTLSVTLPTNVTADQIIGIVPVYSTAYHAFWASDYGTYFDCSAKDSTIYIHYYRTQNASTSRTVNIRVTYLT